MEQLNKKIKFCINNYLPLLLFHYKKLDIVNYVDISNPVSTLVYIFTTENIKCNVKVKVSNSRWPLLFCEKK